MMLNFEVTLKPTGMSRKVLRITPECVYLLAAEDRDAAARKAREAAEFEGFSHYAITKVREVKQ